VIRFVCTSNPFYVVSAALFLAGLRMSFKAEVREIDTWALAGGLAAYTLLLAAAALLLVRFAQVWDDVRTVLLLVVFMFLATSATLDEVIALNPEKGAALYLGGLAFAAVVTEGVLQGIRLRLPRLFRGPYYLLLSLFFVYPMALALPADGLPLFKQPHTPALLWALSGFATVGGVAFLTLLPAVWQGPDYVRGNGSPWRWPFYPWSLFVFFAVAVPLRAYHLCASLHLVEANFYVTGASVFAPFFLVPFGLCVAVVLLELGVVARNRVAQAVALAVPAGLIVVALIGRPGDPLGDEFFALFRVQLGCAPAFLTVFAAVAFYAYAAGRRAPLAAEAAAVAVAALAVVGPDTRTFADLTPPVWEPLAVAAGGILLLGLWRQDPWRCLAAGVALAEIPLVVGGSGGGSERLAVSFHLAVAVVLLVGAAFGGEVGRALRTAGSVMAAAAALAAAVAGFGFPDRVPWWVGVVYPAAVAVLLLGYGLALRHRPAVGAAGVAVAGWALGGAWWGYRSARAEVAGLDYLLLSLAVFAVAVLVSLGKSARVREWGVVRRLLAGERG
jgi:hypothetical protein